MVVKKVKISFLIVIVITTFIFVYNNIVLAQGLATGTPTVYRVTITQFELYNGTSWVTASLGNSATIDIASVNAGEKAGNFFSGLTVPDGTYTQVRVTPSGTFTIQGSVTYLGTTYYTTASTNPVGGGGISSTTAPAVECALNLSGVTASEYTMPSPVTVKDGAASHKVRVSFNVTGALELYAGNEFFPEVPVVTMTLIAN